MYHLPSICAEGLLYCWNRDWGLGNTRVTNHVLISAILLEVRLRTSLERDVAESSDVRSRAVHAALDLELVGVPQTLKELRLKFSWDRESSRNELSWVVKATLWMTIVTIWSVTDGWQGESSGLKQNDWSSPFEIEHDRSSHSSQKSGVWTPYAACQKCH